MSIPTDRPVRAINALHRCINGHSIFDGCHKKPLDASRAGDCTVWGSWHHPGAVLRSDSRWWLTAFALRNGPVRAINALQRCINGHSIFDGCHKKPLDASRAGRLHCLGVMAPPRCCSTVGFEVVVYCFCPQKWTCARHKCTETLHQWAQHFRWMS